MLLAPQLGNEPKYVREKYARLAAVEEPLREAFMHSALEEPRRMLRLRVALEKFEIAYFTGQEKNPRARTAQTTVDKQC